jgi:glutathione S-transferase
VSSSVIENAKHQWEEGYRRFEADARETERAERLYRQLDTILAALRRRVGESFSVADLAAAYDGAEDWAREIVGDTDPPPGWERSIALVTDAAFHVYARGAADYRP